MSELIIFGASGYVGREFLSLVLQDNSYNTVIAVTSSTEGRDFLKYILSEQHELKIVSLEDLGQDSFCNVDVLNFAFPSHGLPWERVNTARKLAKNISDLCLAWNARQLIQISSQSVFGYKFTNDKTPYNKFPLLAPEYSITKQIMDSELCKSLKKSKCQLTIVRLGNVLSNKSAPFYTRLHQILFDKSYKEYCFSGRVNACFIENVTHGIIHILKNPKNTESNNIFHFAEVTEVQWSDIFLEISSSLDLEPHPVVDNVVLQSKTPPYKRLFWRILFPLCLRLLMYIKIPRIVNDYIVYLYRKKRLGQHANSLFDTHLYDIFTEKFEFVNAYPSDFKYVVPKDKHFIKIKEIYGNKQK
jgi:nucleoside-diphosphate-sugar epimerase